MRARRSRATATALGVLAAALLASCGCGSSPAPRPSTAAEAYASAHPSKGLPTTLRATALSPGQIGRRIRGIIGDGTRIVLPVRLPPGFGLAEPYIAVGDGTARPNPEGWGRSYRISYTDGQGLLVVTCGAERLPDGVVWGGDDVHVDGRPAHVGVADGEVVVATTDGRRLIVVTGRGVERGRVISAASSLAPWRE